MSGKRWTKAETVYLRQWYARKGPRYCAHKLNRTVPSVKMRAMRLGLTAGVPRGYVPLAWVAPAKDQGATQRARAAARREGVAEKFEGTCAHPPVVVPEAWADEYAKRLGDEADVIRKTRTWLVTDDVAEVAGVTRDHLNAMLAVGKPGREFFEGVTRVKITRPKRHYRWHPVEAIRAARRYREARR